MAQLPAALSASNFAAAVPFPPDTIAPKTDQNDIYNTAWVYPESKYV